MYDIALVRITAAGVLDMTFGTRGELVMDIDGVSDRVTDMIVDPASHIYLVGYRVVGPKSQGFVLRLTGDGKRDATFGKDGLVDIPGNVLVEAISLAPNGRIVIAGSAFDGTSKAYVARLFP